MLSRLLELGRAVLPDWHSLRTRITVGVLAAVVSTLWIATLSISHSLRQEMEETLSAQQFSVVSLLAEDVDRSVRDRVSAVEMVADRITPALVARPADLKRYLEDRTVFTALFNWGVIVTDSEGKAVASIPEMFRRAGEDYGDVEVVLATLREARTQIGDPLIGKTTRQPLIPIATPLLDENGKVFGTLIGLTNLALPNFLDDISASRFGKQGGYLITAPRTRTFIAATDKTRVMRPGPPPGVNPVYDSYLEGREGSGVARSSRGVVELSSSKRIVTPGWLMQSVLPVDEAFAPIYAMQRQLFGISILLTLLAGVVAWWWLHRQLAPLTEASAILDAMRDGSSPRRSLPIRRNDEIGQLAGAFNGLLDAIIANEAQAAELALNARLNSIVSQVPGMVFQYRVAPDGSSSLPFASEGIRDIYGVAPEDVVKDSSFLKKLIHPDDLSRFLASRQVSADTLAPWRCQYRICLPGGILKWLQVAAIPEREMGGYTVWRGVLTDITGVRHAEDELRVAAAAFQSQESIVITDAQGVIQRVNQAFVECTGYSAEEAVGQTPRLLNSGRHDQAFYDAMWRGIREGGRWQGEIWNRRKSGEVYPEWLTITAVRDAEGRITNFVGMFQDITARKLAEDEIRSLAFYDPLTQLPNRRLLMDRLRQGVAAAARSGAYGALLFIDLDNFKLLNDTLGHDMGDLLLREVARRLRNCVREADTVARMGGDEFVVMLEGLSTAPAAAASQVEQLAEKIRETLAQPYELAGHSHHSTSSIGVALFRDREVDVEELLKRADMAMYEAKEAGRNALRFFDPAMQAAVENRSSLEGQLRRAVRRGEFLLHYQIQVDRRGCPTGVEALVRWQHPQRGLVMPGEFIGLAEEAGLIVPLGNWVLAAGCAQLAAWRDDPVLGGLALAVNVSARQFRQADFVESVRGALAASGADPGRLKLELTESLLLQEVEATVARMEELRRLGVSFSLDDFGTGYSSLAYLKRLPISQLKIDQSFVRDILTDPNDAAIARAVIALGKSLGLVVIAEGVETGEQWDLLQQEGCDQAQGYYYGRPLPAGELASLAHNLAGRA